MKRNMEKLTKELKEVFADIFKKPINIKLKDLEDIDLIEKCIIVEDSIEIHPAKIKSPASSILDREILTDGWEIYIAHETPANKYEPASVDMELKCSSDSIYVIVDTVCELTLSYELFLFHEKKWLEARAKEQREEGRAENGSI